jgi:predicted nuclease with TOPRIM domain
MTQSILGSLDQSVTRIHDKAASQHRSGMSTKKKVGLVAAGLALLGGVAAVGGAVGYKRGEQSLLGELEEQRGENLIERQKRMRAESELVGTQDEIRRLKQHRQTMQTAISKQHEQIYGIGSRRR